MNSNPEDLATAFYMTLNILVALFFYRQGLKEKGTLSFVAFGLCAFNIFMFICLLQTFSK